MSLSKIVEQARSCTLCAADLPFGCRPILQISNSARVMIIGQAPGSRVHKSGIPWDDPSGDRLRQWLGVSKEQFYDNQQFNILPMGLCYPGKGKSGDLPPMARCAPQWHQRIQAELKHPQLTLLIGQYAQNHYLGANRRRTLTETVENWQDYLPEFLPMPHPSPRNGIWLARNPWFENEVVPWLSGKVKQVFTEGTNK